jgi:hypothetical protein
MKTYLTLLLLISVLMCQGQDKVSVKLHDIKGYEGYTDFADQAIKKLEAVINSEKFRQEVLSGDFTKTNGLTNQEILNSILKAHEVEGPGGQDSVIDLRLRTLTLERDGSIWMKNCEIGSNAGTIGIDGNKDGIAAICPQHLKMWSDTGDVGALAGHYMHEYMHILGFSHSILYKSRTAVYKIGYIVRDTIHAEKL